MSTTNIEATDLAIQALIRIGYFKLQPDTIQQLVNVYTEKLEELSKQDPQTDDFAYWYWKACDSSQPYDWMRAALAAQQVLETSRPTVNTEE